MTVQTGKDISLIFEKYTGIGNDYLIYDCQKNEYALQEKDVKWICNRNFGVGSDGILVGPYFYEDKIGLTIYNPDGSIAEKSGNGVRIFAKYLLDAGYVKKEDFILKTLGGNVTVHYEDDDNIIKVSMGRLSFMSDDVGISGDQREVVNEPFIFGDKEYLCTCASIGNPHCVIPMKQISRKIVCDIGKYSENAPYFANRINTQIVRVIDRQHIAIEIYERGAGYTLSSGSSSCAAAGAMYKLGLVDHKVTVSMPGGDLLIEITEDMQVYMTGAVEKICRIWIP